MASKQTTNYALPQWEANDLIRRADFNDLTQKLDAALAAETAERKGAVSAEATARQNAVSAEAGARQSADAALQTRVAMLETKTALQTLKTHTVSSATSSVTLSLSDIAFASYKAVHIELALSGTGYWYPMFNTTALSGFSIVTARRCRITLLPLYDGALTVSGFLIGAGAPQPLGTSEVKYAALTSLRLCAGPSTATTFNVTGGRITVYGEK